MEYRDLVAVLTLNREWEHFLNPQDEESLRALVDLTDIAIVAETEGVVEAFLLGMGPGRAYDSDNYRWFAERHEDFLYIDRVVVSGDVHGAGLGGALYDYVSDRARERGVPVVVCEVDIEPMNAVSDRFHARRGFVEVGRQRVGESHKLVSLRELVL